MSKVLPSKGQIISGLIVTALGLYVYNKSVTVRKALGAAS